MTEYVWRGNKPLRRSQSRDGSTIEPGETFDPTHRELEHLGDDIETVDAKAADAPVSASEPPFDPTDLSVSELRETVADGDYTDAELDAAATLERERTDREDGPRSTALDVLGSN